MIAPGSLSKGVSLPARAAQDTAHELLQHSLVSGEQEGAAREGLTTPPPLPWQSLQSSAVCNKTDNEWTLKWRLDLLRCAQFT